MTQRRAAACVLIGAGLFGTVGIAKGLGPAAPDLELAWIRVLLTTVVFAAIAGAGLVAAVRLPHLWVAGVAQAVFQVAIFTAFTRIGVASGTLIGIGLSPLITGLLKRSWSWAWAGSTVLGLSGLAMLVGGGGADDSAGVGIGLLAATALSVYIIAIGGHGEDALPVAASSAVIFGVAAVTLTVPALISGSFGWAATMPAWSMIAFIVVVPTVVAYRLYNAGSARLPPPTTATFGLMEPVVAALLGIVVLGESLSVTGLLGAMLILSAVVLLVRLTIAPEPVRDNG